MSTEQEKSYRSAIFTARESLALGARDNAII